MRMKLKQHHIERDDRPHGQASPTASKPEEVADKPMKCVWSGYLDHNRDCRSRIPASVVVKAWHREIQLKGTVEGFFYFTWRNGVWLAYGLREGGVRGVYCPTHCHQRDAREASTDDAGVVARDARDPATEDPVERPTGIALQ
jgi:hypothetical protein